MIHDERKPGANLSLDRATFSPARAFVGSSSRVTAVVRNHAAEPQDTTIVVKDGDQTGQERPLTLAPGESLHVDLVQRFESPLDTVCTVELPDDSHPGDNRFFVPMRMRDRRQVLLVASGETDEPQDTTVRFTGLDLLTYALNPGEALGLGGGTQVSVKRVTPQSLQRVSLPLYSLIVVYGVVDLPEQSLKDLRAFALGGGVVWLIPDPEASPVRFNETFAGLLGGTTVGQLTTAESPRGVDRDEAAIGHPLLLPLLRDEWGPANDIFFHRYWQVDVKENVALRAANGDVLAALFRRDRGWVLLQTFACDLESSSLPRSSAFVPFVQQIVSTLADRGRNDRPDAIRVGEVLRLRVPEFRNLHGDVTVAGPETKTVTLSGEERDEVRIAGLQLAGDYKVTHAARPGGRERRLAVNPADGESDLLPLDDESLAALFSPGEIARLPFAELGGRFQHRREIGSTVAIAVLAVLVIEALSAAWFSRRGARRKTAGGVA